MPKRQPPPAMSTPPPGYQEWLAHVFDRPVTNPGWYFPDFSDTSLPPVDIHFHGTCEEIAALFIHTMRHCREDLARYSDGQVYHGLTYIISNSCSDLSDDLKSASLSNERRSDVLRSISTLYTDCFALRCAPVLSHIDEAGANALNGVCYMFWDITPLLCWGKDPDKQLFYDVLIEVLSRALTSVNPACVESALHGLGHLHQLMGSSSPVEGIITNFIQTRPARPELKTYAAKAARGQVL